MLYNVAASTGTGNKKGSGFARIATVVKALFGRRRNYGKSGAAIR